MDIKIPEKDLNKVHIFKTGDKHKKEIKNVYDENQPKNWWSFPQGVKILLVGASGVGKTNSVANMLTKRQEPIHKVYTITPPTTDYDFVGKRLRKYTVEKPPKYETLVKNKNNILIIDDIDIAAQSKQFQKYVTELFTHVSSHSGLTVIVSCHSLTSCLPIQRRSANVIFVFHTPDLQVIKTQIFSKVGAKPKDVEHLFELMKTPFDFIVIDLISNTKARYRLNNVVPIDFKNEE